MTAQKVDASVVQVEDHNGWTIGQSTGAMLASQNIISAELCTAMQSHAEPCSAMSSHVQP
jgi:hypothetical protein